MNADKKKMQNGVEKKLDFVSKVIFFSLVINLKNVPK